MTQHDLDLANDTAAAFRADANLALKALGSTSSGATEPATMFANQLWYDTSTSTLKKRNADNDAWISIAIFDETGDLITSISLADITVTGDITNSLIRMKPYYIENLDFTLSTQTVTVHGADGTALGASNPGYICLPSNSTPGNLILYTITANVSMTNTEMNGNLLGTTASTAHGDSRLLYLYALSNDNEDAIAFAWGCIPHIKKSPVSTEIGDPSSAVADEQISLYAWDDITETSYDDNNCSSFGTIKATKDASDIWSFDAMIEGEDGMGLFQESNRLDYTEGNHGANSGTYTVPNGGTPAVFSTSRTTYRMFRNGFILADISLGNDGGTDGSGAVDAKFTLPFYASDDIHGIAGHETTIQIREPGGSYYQTSCHIRSDNQNTFTLYNQSSQILDWADFSSGSRNVRGSVLYYMKPYV
jgi:hypothetical protein